MNSFIITYKPVTESPERGMSEKYFAGVVRKLDRGEDAVEPWRFRAVGSAIGDRVFLLLQGRMGPAIIGYGRVAGPRGIRERQPGLLVRFEKLVDPEDGDVLAGKDELAAVPEKYLRTQFSGRLLDAETASLLEEMVVPRTAGAVSTVRNDAISDLDDEAAWREPVVTWRYARDNKIRDAVRQRANGLCEHCGKPGFFCGDGSRYVERHHIIALANDGADKMENVIALCADHHREAHYGVSKEKLESLT